MAEAQRHLICVDCRHVRCIAKGAAPPREKLPDLRLPSAAVHLLLRDAMMMMRGN